MKIFKMLSLLFLVSILAGACSSTSGRSVANADCDKQEWVDAENYFRDYEECKGF